MIALWFYFFGDGVSDSNIGLLMEDDYQGRIIDKYIDYDNHAIRTIVFENDEEATVWTRLYDVIEIGDSISKTKNDSLYWVYKQKDTIIYNGTQDLKK